VSQPASRSRLITMLRAVGEELRGRAGSYLGAVLVKRPVPHVMLTVFHFPVAAVAGQQVGGLACQAVRLVIPCTVSGLRSGFQFRS